MLDTQANGTAIHYDAARSSYSKDDQTKQDRVYLAAGSKGYIDGWKAFDQVCFDSEGELCSMDQCFVYGDFIKYPAPNREQD